jgi:hypothetical protein
MPVVATDMYLPSLPEVAAELGTTAAAAQFTITGMVLGGAVGQLDVGGLVGLLVPLWCTVAALGFISADASALAMSRHGERSGTAAATIDVVQSAVAGPVSPLVCLLGGDGVATAPGLARVVRRRPGGAGHRARLPARGLGGARRGVTGR